MTAIRSLLFLVGAMVITSIFGFLVPLGGLFGFERVGGQARAHCAEGEDRRRGERSVLCRHRNASSFTMWKGRAD